MEKTTQGSTETIPDSYSDDSKLDLEQTLTGVPFYRQWKVYDKGPSFSLADRMSCQLMPLLLKTEISIQLMPWLESFEMSCQLIPLLLSVEISVQLMPWLESFEMSCQLIPLLLKVEMSIQLMPWLESFEMSCQLIPLLLRVEMWVNEPL